MTASPAKHRDAELLRVLRDEYELDGELTPLPGENRNVRIDVDGTPSAVLKVSETSDDAADLELQAVAHVAESDLDVAVPEVIRTRRGESSVSLCDGERTLRARLYRHVPGVPWSDLAWSNLDEAADELLNDLGQTLARLDDVLSSFRHPGAKRTHRWDLARAERHRADVALVTETDRRQLLEHAFQVHAACALPLGPRLRRSFVHGDANDENVLVTGGRITALLDFGDALVNPLACELAVAITYVMLGRDEPLAAAARVVHGYDSVTTLTDDELDALFPLVLARLATSVLVAAQRRAAGSQDPAHFTTEPRAWELLEFLTGVAPSDARDALTSCLARQGSTTDGDAPGRLLERRRRSVGPSLSISYDEPLKIVRGSGQYLHDHRGRPYLDLVNNVCHVGHCHPRVVEAGHRQMGRLNTNTRYLHDGLVDYADRLAALLPEPLSVCYFVCSGSEANELAVRLARTHSGRRGLIVVDGAYHGHTSTLIELSPYKFMGPGGSGTPAAGVHVVPMPDGYRGKYRGEGRDVGSRYAAKVAEVARAHGADVAAFLAEPLLGCGGQVLPPEGFLAESFTHVREAGGACIADEVQVGFGRVGSRFWGFELHDVVPDVVVMGKPIGNGHPLAAVVTTPEIAASFDNGMEFFSTFGGNPVSCAIGMAVLDVIEDEGLQDRAHVLGTRFLDGLRALQERHPLVGEARGAGLFLGLQLVGDADTRAPAPTQAAELVSRMVRRGVLLSTDGPENDAIKIKPPLAITADDVDMTLRLLDDELTAIQER